MRSANARMPCTSSSSTASAWRSICANVSSSRLVEPVGQMMQNPIYVGRVESSDYGVSTKGDFEPLVDEATFYRAEHGLRAGDVGTVVERHAVPARTLSSLEPPSSTFPPLTSKGPSLDTAGSALTGRHQPAAREHSHLFDLSRVRVHLLSGLVFSGYRRFMKEGCHDRFQVSPRSSVSRIPP